MPRYFWFRAAGEEAERARNHPAAATNTGKRGQLLHLKLTTTRLKKKKTQAPSRGDRTPSTALLLLSRRPGLNGLLGGGRVSNWRALLLQSPAGRPLYLKPAPRSLMFSPHHPSRGFATAWPLAASFPPAPHAASRSAASPGPPPPAAPRAWARRANALTASLLPSKWRRGGWGGKAVGGGPGHGGGKFPPRGGPAAPAREGGGRRAPAPPRPAAPAAPGPGSCHDDCGRKAPPSPRRLAASGPSSAPPLLSAPARRSDPLPRARSLAAGRPRLARPPAPGAAAAAPPRRSEGNGWS